LLDLSLAYQRIAERALHPVPDELRVAIEASPDPERAVTQLERWLQASGNPATYLSTFEAHPILCRGVALLLGFSRQMGDVLVQNPEVGSLLIDPSQWQPASKVSLIEEGRRLFAHATSPSHRLDRLRFLRQRTILLIAFCDLIGIWKPHQVWRSLSDLAEAIVTLARDEIWAPVALERNLKPECPVSIVAFGKLGGHELNYSSDIDLVYLLDDSADEELEKYASRFCNSLTRAMSDEMGRGKLYRVDLRLRPFGGQGPVLSKWRSVESYYSKYAEMWERLALVRSRLITGDGTDRWEALRNQVAFGPSPSGWQIEELLAQRLRLEDLSQGDDLKRGPGGIRDIEFLTQILQLIHGQEDPELRRRETQRAIDSLVHMHYLDSSSAETLSHGYTLLRQVEHRIQLEDDRQTHTIPDDPTEFARLAKVMGDGPAIFRTLLTTARTNIRAVYDSMLPTLIQNQPHGLLREKLGGQIPMIEEWFGSLQESETYLASALESRDGLDRIRRIAERAPMILDQTKGNDSFAEALISGEILEEFSPDFRTTDMPLKAKMIQRAHTRVCASWVLDPMGSLSDGLDGVRDALFRELLGGLPLECVALGSYASHETTPGSDADIVLFCPEGVRHLDAEEAAQGFVREVQNLKSAGSPVTIDLRLRPEGRSGLLARTYESFQKYVSQDMEAWEKLAAIRSRLIVGSPHAQQSILSAANSLVWDSTTAQNLMHMKSRIEKERVTPIQAPRHLKLGPGGLEDILWLTSFWWIADPEIRVSGLSLSNRLKSLRDRQHLTAVESDALQSAHKFLLELRWWIELQGFVRDVLPENPHKLDTLAHAMAVESANQLLHQHGEHRHAVRAIFEDHVQRLKR